MTSTGPVGQNPPPVYLLRPHRGGTVLALGILALASLPLSLSCGCCFCFFLPSPIFGIIAWAMGASDLKEIDRGFMDPAGRSNTSAGWICGIIATVLNFLIVLAATAVMLLSLASGLQDVIKSK